MKALLVLSENKVAGIALMVLPITFLFYCLSLWPGPVHHCDTTLEWDIVLLVDSSWSVGRANFRLVKNFLWGILSPLHISKDKIRVGNEITVSWWGGGGGRMGYLGSYYVQKALI